MIARITRFYNSRLVHRWILFLTKDIDWPFVYESMRFLDGVRWVQYKGNDT